MALLDNLIDLLLDAAPWLLLGLLMAGLIKAWLPSAWVSRHLAGGGVAGVIKAALVGAPLPLCSCGVVPAAFGLHRAGASRGSTVSFLVATPETGVDSVAVSHALLGPLMALVRPLAAISSAVVAGLLTQWSERGDGGVVTPSAGTECGGGCCDSSPVDSVPAVETPLRRTLSGVEYAFSDLYDDIIWWLFGGLLFASAVQTWVPPSLMAEWGSGLPAMLAMCAIGVPMYICATASTPIAAGLIAAGVSPGTALVFLLAGPATNLSTLGLIRKELGGRTLGTYLLGTLGTALASGLALDWLLADSPLAVQAAQADEEVLPVWLSTASAVLLVLASVRPLRRWVFAKPAAEADCCGG